MALLACRGVKFALSAPIFLADNSLRNTDSFEATA